MALTREALLGFFESEMGLDPADVADETPLFSGGLLDSFSMVDLIQFLEAETGTRMSAGDVSLENLDSVARILAYARSASGDGG